MKRVFIVHRWEGNPNSDWYPWLKKELESLDCKVFIFEMPDTDNPKINAWVSTLKEKVGTPDKNTFFIGHSIGCQTILRYLESLNENIKVGGAIFVAGWMTLTPTVLEDEEGAAIAKPWIKTPIDWDKVKKHTDKFIAIFSDNDPYVPIDNSELFKEKLNAKIIVEKEKGHFNDETNIKEVPIVLEKFKEFL